MEASGRTQRSKSRLKTRAQHGIHAMKPSHLLFLFSDQHARRFTGCYGHPIVPTPNLDALARRGTLCSNAYTPAPIRVPALASLATRRHVYDHACWDNARPYTGAQSSWGHRLQANGNTVLSIGKLHYRNDTDDMGFDAQRLPMHVIDGEGMLFSIARDPIPVGKGFRIMVQAPAGGEQLYAVRRGHHTGSHCVATQRSSASGAAVGAVRVPRVSTPSIYRAA